MDSRFVEWTTGREEVPPEVLTELADVAMDWLQEWFTDWGAQLGLAAAWAEAIGLDARAPHGSRRAQKPRRGRAGRGFRPGAGPSEPGGGARARPPGLGRHRPPRSGPRGQALRRGARWRDGRGRIQVRSQADRPSFPRPPSKAAGDGALLAFYQLREHVLVPGTNGTHELGEADHLRDHGALGVLVVTKSPRPGNPGRITYWNAHDEPAFRAAMARITDKKLVAGTGAAPDAADATGNYRAETRKFAKRAEMAGCGEAVLDR